VTRRRITGIAVAVLLVALAASVAYKLKERRDTIGLAAEAYLYALPLVLMDVTREETFKHPAAAAAEPNRMYNIPILADARFRTVIRPNVDTLYSIAWLSLEKEPLILSVPRSEGRYFVVQFMDAWTNVFAAPGIRTLGDRPGTFFIVGPGYTGPTPAGMERIAAPTDMVWMLARVHAKGDEDLRAAQVLQHRIDLRPASRLGDADFGPALPDPAGRDAKRSEPLEIVRNMDAQQFYARFSELLNKNPPAKADGPFIERVLDPLGLSPARPLRWGELAAPTRRQLERGKEAVWKVLTERAAVERARTPTGWAGFEAVGKIGAYGTDYKTRAGVAAFGLAANLPQDAVYLNASVDAKGRDLAGGKSYRLRFAPGETPPVNGFWSITLYDRAGYLVDHPLHRYAIKQFDPLVYERDGSLTLYIQPDDPGPARRANWLPSPASGNFVLSLRAYWPGKRILERDWMPPGLIAASGQ
jgi:hypothetical protein